MRKHKKFRFIPRPSPIFLVARNGSAGKLRITIAQGKWFFIGSGGRFF